MESLAVILEPYRDLIAYSASIATNIHQLSGAVLCNNIRKQKSTDGHSALPFLFGIVISALAGRFGSIVNDSTTVTVSWIGTALNIGYMLVFFYYANNKDKSLAWSQIGYAGAFLAAVFAYTYIENPENLPFRYGMIFTAIMFYIVGSPLLGLREIIRKKSVEGLPFPIIATGTLISFLWFLHGVVSRETFVIVQNGVFFVLSLVQLSLFAIYPSKPVKSSKGSSPTKNGNNNKKKN